MHLPRMARIAWFQIASTPHVQILECHKCYVYSYVIYRPDPLELWEDITTIRHPR